MTGTPPPPESAVEARPSEAPLRARLGVVEAGTEELRLRVEQLRGQREALAVAVARDTHVLVGRFEVALGDGTGGFRSAQVEEPRLHLEAGAALGLFDLVAEGLGLGPGLGRRGGSAPAVPRREAQADADAPCALPLVRQRQHARVRTRVIVGRLDQCLWPGRRLRDLHPRLERLSPGPQRGQVGARRQRFAHQLRKGFLGLDGGRLEGLRRFDLGALGEAREPQEVRLRQTRAVLRNEPLELGAVPIHLHGQELVARGHPQLQAVARVLQMRLVGAERLAQHALRLAGRDEPPVPARGVEDEVAATGLGVLRGRIPGMDRRVDGALDAAARPERKRDLRPGAVGVGDVREEGAGPQTRSRDDQLGHVGVAGVGRLHVQLGQPAGACTVQGGGRRLLA